MYSHAVPREEKEDRFTLKIEAFRSYETFVNYLPEDTALHLKRSKYRLN